MRLDASGASDEIRRLEAMAARMRIKAMKMALACGTRGAHVSGSLSCMEIYAVLYGGVLRLSRECWDERDRFIAGKEHARLAEYPAMQEVGLIDEDELLAFEQDGSVLAGHQPDKNRGMEYCSCSLGMGLSFAVGKALAAKLGGRKYHVYTLAGDGEFNEGMMWEAILAAAQFKLDNLTLIIDRNGMSVDGDTEDILALGDLQKKLEAFGWKATTVDGHSVAELLSAFAQEPDGRPNAIVARTVKGKGIPFIEGRKEWHQAVLSEKQYQEAMRCLSREEPR